MIENEGGSIARLRLVKLAFLLSREDGAPRTGVYEFVPYKRGPFSFTLYHDLRSLERDGWVCGKDEREFALNECPTLETSFLESSFLALIDRLSNQHRATPTSALVEAVYRDHPWFTVNSETTHRRHLPKPVGELAVYAIGYEGITVDGLLDLLLRAGVKRLVDVRSNPVARRYGFHKSTLCRLCSDLNIEYVHFASLGVPSAWRSDLSEPSSYEKLFDRYIGEVLPKQWSAVEAVCKMVAEIPTALMCMEASHHSCHRSRLAAEVSRRTSLVVRELRTF